MDGYREKSATQIVDEIQSKKEIELPLFIVGLGIPNVGLETAHTLAGTFGTLEALKVATKEELTDIKDVGDVVAESIVDFFASVKSEEIVGGL